MNKKRCKVALVVENRVFIPDNTLSVVKHASCIPDNTCSVVKHTSGVADNRNPVNCFAWQKDVVVNHGANVSAPEVANRYLSCY